MSVRAVAIGAAVGALLLAGLLAERHWYGAAQYRAGAAAKQVEIEKRQLAIERGWQEEKDRADAERRGAVLARQAVEAQLVKSDRDRAAAVARIDGLRRQLAQRDAASTSASSRPDATGPDWIGVFGECLGRAESLGRRLSEVGKDAAGWADQVNGLQGYVRALGVKPSSR
ncbi:hypothetical protein [Bordetella trematum]|uniref:hypothetical protein n=2 Tax=Bordetella trematum TaxID=123899 RepID=UPI0007B54F99|nr:hypothetical protein [Bordetella trematum]